MQPPSRLFAPRLSKDSGPRFEVRTCSVQLGPSLLLGPAGPRTPDPTAGRRATPARRWRRSPTPSSRPAGRSIAKGSRSRLGRAGLRPRGSLGERGAAPRRWRFRPRQPCLRPAAFLPPREGKESRLRRLRPRAAAPPRKEARRRPRLCGASLSARRGWPGPAASGASPPLPLPARPPAPAPASPPAGRPEPPCGAE